MADKRDYYSVLGVGRDADADEIKKSYRRLAMKYHPDRNAGDSAAEEKFKEVQEAYACLSDGEKRRMYDRYGHSAFEGAGGGGFEFGGGGFGSFFDNAFDPFSSIFGQSSQRQQREQRVLNATIRFEEMAAGCEKDIRISLAKKCGECGGSGAASDADLVECGTCDGEGQVRMRRGPFTVQQTCPDCRGRGRTISRVCDACDGKGQVRDTRRLSVRIPAGIHNEGLMRLNIADTVNEEIYLRVLVKPHPIFERDDNNNLQVRIPIALPTAALGGEVVLPSLQGKKTKVKIPEGIQSGQVLRLSGLGLPRLRRGGRGDLYCEIAVETPVHLSDKQKDLLRKFQRSLKDEHTPQNESWLNKIKGLFTP